MKECNHKKTFIELVADTPEGCRIWFSCYYCHKSAVAYGDDVVFEQLAEI